jgi:ribosomal protein L37AE/L43A
MGAIRKAAGWVTVTMPARIAGVGGIKTNNAVIRDLWHSLTYPQCPDCRATLAVEQSPSPEKTWFCQRCGFSITSALAPRDLSKHLMADYVLPAAQTQASHFFIDNDTKTLLRLARQHERGAWVSLIALGALLAYLIYAIASGHPLFQLVGIAALGAPLAVFYLKYRYRGWQVRTQHLFQAGGFSTYVKSGLWCMMP